MRELKDRGQTRLREGDEVLAVVRGLDQGDGGSSQQPRLGYVLRINDIPATTGYGDPVQKLFKFDDGERRRWRALSRRRRRTRTRAPPTWWR